MSELDLGLKVGARRLLWSMGFSTRLDVELRGDPKPAQSGSKNARGAGREWAGPETFTDLDVLGVLLTPNYRLTTAIADCKSGRRDKPTARMFWARGVADLFGADQIMLVREHDVNDATRQLSSRLGITVLPSADLALMQQLHGSAQPDPSDPLGLLFDREAASENLAAFHSLDSRLNSLMEYRQFDYWIYEHHRNPIQLVAHLKEAGKHLDPRNPIHLALFLDLAWLYLLALVRVTEHLRGAFLRDPDRGLQEYLFGGATQLREKEETAALLRTVAPTGSPDLDHLPAYYSNMRELVARLLRRPNEIQEGLRYAEVASALMAAKKRIPLGDVFGRNFDPVAAKLVADVCGFLVASAGLSPSFRAQARAYLLGEPLPGVNRQEKSIVGQAPASPVSKQLHREEQHDQSEPKTKDDVGDGTTDDRPSKSPNSSTAPGSTKDETTLLDERVILADQHQLDLRISEPKPPNG
ncbi:hypothetical protein [Arthrobacter tumbae]|uniref:hypothetical protein n=1 Tax=Arthrobacter tumbae TaxID=163874 RepID=UPI00195E0CF1|nr:hypothetical protein [Arthrobacter tumbae]MBM7782251.1 hypothetical protein [Arthrobacter tumbae]